MLIESEVKMHDEEEVYAVKMVDIVKKFLGESKK